MSFLKCLVKSLPNEADLLISFKYTSSFISERLFNLKRSKSEKVGCALTRIVQNINNCVKKGQRKKFSSSPAQAIPEIKVQLESGGQVVSQDLPNEEAWKDGNTLRIDDRVYQIVLNAPRITCLKLPKCIMAGFPILPFIEAEFCETKCIEFIWYKQRLERGKGENNLGEISDLEEDVGCEDWIKAGVGLPFVPTNEDIGKIIKLKCIPGDGARKGFELEIKSENAVQAGPGFCPFEERHCFTKEVAAKDSLRVVTYNILADLYADSDYSRTILYPQCPPFALDFDYRKQLILKEICGYNADIYFLQEVDTKMYTFDLNPTFELMDFSGVYSEKGKTIVEGLACFFRNTKLKLINSSAISLSESLLQNSIFSNVLKVIKQNENLLKRLEDRASIFQYAFLKSLDQPEIVLLCCNTHLYFHPDADHIRLIQAYLCVRLIEQLMEDFQKENPGLEISPIFCGDFNSCPEFGVYQLLTNGCTPKELNDWRSNSEESIDGLSLDHRLKLASACGTPRYTNYVRGFNGCLDYIFYDKNRWSVTDVIPFPSHEDVTQFEALPNIVFPSDHIASVCTLTFRKNNEFMN